MRQMAMGQCVANHTVQLRNIELSSHTTIHIDAIVSNRIFEASYVG